MEINKSDLYPKNLEKDVSILVGKIITNIEVSDGKTILLFTTSDDKFYKMYHEQDCGEDIYLEDVNGDMADLIGVPLLTAEAISNNNKIPFVKGRNHCHIDMASYTWTFFKFETSNGFVVLRWCGNSNGCYSEEVEFSEISEKEIKRLRSVWGFKDISTLG